MTVTGPVAVRNFMGEFIDRLRNLRRRRGILGLATSVPRFCFWKYRYWVDHAKWDRRWGTETSTNETEYLRSIDSSVAEHAEFYEPIKWRVFRRMLKDVPVDVRDSHFIDLGSGKGRAVFFAAIRGFPKAVGVEFAEFLHEIAMRNLSAFSSRQKTDCEIALVCGDAAEYAFPDGPLVILLYNPFRGETMERVIAAIGRHASRTGERTFVLYLNPKCTSMFEESDDFTQIVERQGNRRSFFGRESYSIYEARTGDKSGRPAHDGG